MNKYIVFVGFGCEFAVCGCVYNVCAGYSWISTKWIAYDIYFCVKVVVLESFQKHALTYTTISSSNIPNFVQHKSLGLSWSLFYVFNFFTTLKMFAPQNKQPNVIDSMTGSMEEW